MNKIFTLITAMCVAVLSNAQTISVPFELTTMTIDGQINASEWQNADSAKIGLSPTDTVTVFYKHDMQNLYFAFCGPLESYIVSAMFPEVLIDPQQLGGSAWQNGQWWFHVSATDCENNGGYGVYNNCQVTQPDWEGAPNQVPGPPDTDSMEMRIPYSKLGFNAVTQYNLGLAFVITNTTNLYYTWPPTADKDVPSTWADAKIIKFPVGTQNVESNKSVSIYPNPAANQIKINGLKNGCHVKLIDALGKVVKTEYLSTGDNAIDISAIPAGVYQLQLVESDAIITTSVSIVR